MSAPGLRFHHTVSEYRECPADRKHDRLSNITDYDTILEEPVNKTPAIRRTVDNTQVVLRTVLDALEAVPHGPSHGFRRRIFNAFFCDDFSQERWARIYANIKRLSPFADNPYATDLTIVLGDDHLFEALVKIPSQWGMIDCLVDTTCDGISHQEGTNYVPAQATYPIRVLNNGGCDKTSTYGHVFHESAAQWQHQTLEPLKMIFICPNTLNQRETSDSDDEHEDLTSGDSQEVIEYKPEEGEIAMDHVQGPVQLKDGRSVRETDDLESLCGAPMLLIHELLHSQLMKADGGEPVDDTKFRVDGLETRMYGEEFCRRAAADPNSMALCENNADSYMFFIAAMYLLEVTRWDFSGDT